MSVSADARASTSASAAARTAEHHWLVVASGCAALALAAHVLRNGEYGYFRDELYYLDAAGHLDWGYVDFPPLVALIAWLSRTLLGDSLPAVRLLPALAAAGNVLLTGWITHELDGRRCAVLLASLGVLLAPIDLGIGAFLSMNAIGRCSG